MADIKTEGNEWSHHITPALGAVLPSSSSRMITTAAQWEVK